MPKKPSKTPTKPSKTPTNPRKNLGGRPSRAERTAKALQMLGVDPASVDPRRILAAIAADLSTPAAARIAACKALLVGVSLKSAAEFDDGIDEITRQALAAMNAPPSSRLN